MGRDITAKENVRSRAQRKMKGCLMQRKMSGRMCRDITTKENVRSWGNREGKCQVTGAEENVRLLDAKENVRLHV